MRARWEAAPPARGARRRMNARKLGAGRDALPVYTPTAATRGKWRPEAYTRGTPVKLFNTVYISANVVVMDERAN